MIRSPTAGSTARTGGITGRANFNNIIITESLQLLGCIRNDPLINLTLLRG